MPVKDTGFCPKGAHTAPAGETYHRPPPSSKEPKTAPQIHGNICPAKIKASAIQVEMIRSGTKSNSLPNFQIALYENLVHQLERRGKQGTFQQCLSRRRIAPPRVVSPTWLFFIAQSGAFKGRQREGPPGDHRCRRHVHHGPLPVSPATTQSLSSRGNVHGKVPVLWRESQGPPTTSLKKAAHAANENFSSPHGKVMTSKSL